MPMLEKPDLQDEKIIVCLRDEYGLNVVRVAFLPVETDRNTAAYRAVTDNARLYFVKVRRGVFDETSVMLPKFLSDQGIVHIIAPLAAKERDLMFIGGGLVGVGHTPQEEVTLFYRTYGQTQIDPIALAYYRYERILQDIAEFCELILSTNGDGKDREQSFQYLISNFLPNSVLEIAYKSDKTLRAG
jgi:hypothetical protein